MFLYMLHGTQNILPSTDLHQNVNLFLTMLSKLQEPKQSFCLTLLVMLSSWPHIHSRQACSGPETLHQSRHVPDSAWAQSLLHTCKHFIGNWLPAWIFLNIIAILSFNNQWQSQLIFSFLWTLALYGQLNQPKSKLF